MKRPQHMTMDELVALPVMTSLDELWRDSDPEVPRAHGGAFKDDDGFVWRTVRLQAGWVRYPAYLSVFPAPQANGHDNDHRADSAVPSWTLGQTSLGQGVVTVFRRCFGGAAPRAAA